MRRQIALGALCLLALRPIPGDAQSTQQDPWLEPDAFRAAVQGQIMRTQHEDSGTVFGHEAFGPNDTVTWQYPNGRCLTGRWKAIRGSVCYRYDGVPGESCLRYRFEATQLIGHQWRNAYGDGGDSGEKLLLTPSPKHSLTCGPAPNS